MQLIINANASEASQIQELRRPSPLTASHTTRPIHTQEVTGSSPVAPTIPTFQNQWFAVSVRSHCVF
jgi:hypothetical protein